MTHATWHMLPAQELTPSVACAELHVQHCNDFFSVGNGAWSAISCVKSLKRLAIDDLHCRLDADSLKELATMTQVKHTHLAKSPCLLWQQLLHQLLGTLIC